MNNKTDWIEVIENPDGTVTLNLDIDAEMRGLILSATGKKRLTQKLVQKFVLDAIQHQLNSYEDG